MSYNHTEDEYHLTRSGWVLGFSKYSSQEETQRRPDDTVETWTRFKEQSLGWAEEHVSWTLSWYDSTVSEEERTALRRIFEDPTEDFPGS
jgi:hypothetical protein